MPLCKYVFVRPIRGPEQCTAKSVPLPIAPGQ